MGLRNVGVITLLFASCLFQSSCKKGNTSGDANASVSIVQSDDHCDLVTASGIYTTGVAVTAAEKITLDVNVSRAGDYALSTDTLNNFYFSSKGTFNAPGVHTVTLSASGTPLQEGTYHFMLIGSGLHFSVQVVNNQVVQTEDVPAGVYIEGTNGDEVIDMNFPAASADGPWGYGGIDTALFISLIGYGQYPNNPAGTGDIALQKQFMYGLAGGSDEVFKAFFKPQSYPIAFAKCDIHRSDGFLVSWTDHHNTAWTTKKDYDQSGSYVKIVGIEDGYRTDGRYFVKTRTRIKCKMYRFTDDAMREMNVEIVSYFVRPFF